MLEYLEKHKTITMLESIMKLGVNHPQHAIMVLRREGYPITDKWEKNPITKKRYKELIMSLYIPICYHLLVLL